MIERNGNRKGGKAEMSATRHIVEGTWEEISRQAESFAGKLLRVEVLDNGQAIPEEGKLPFHATATKEERIRALREYAASHRGDGPPLSDEAISRESIYFGEE